jgi:hypothetical protein
MEKVREPSNPVFCKTLSEPFRVYIMSYPQRETVTVYCDNHIEHKNTLCRQNAYFWYVKAGGTYSNHWTLKARCDAGNVLTCYAEFFQR